MYAAISVTCTAQAQQDILTNAVSIIREKLGYLRWSLVQPDTFFSSRPPILRNVSRICHLSTDRTETSFQPDEELIEMTGSAHVLICCKML